VLIPGAIKLKKSQCAESQRTKMSGSRLNSVRQANVLLSQFSGQTVPQPWSGDPKTSIA